MTKNLSFNAQNYKTNWIVQILSKTVPFYENYSQFPLWFRNKKSYSEKLTVNRQNGLFLTVKGTLHRDPR